MICRRIHPPNLAHHLGVGLITHSKVISTISLCVGITVVVAILQNVGMVPRRSLCGEGISLCIR